MSELSGQTAVVTGSTSGIGRAIVLELASAGADCFVHGRRSEAAAREVVELIRRHGGTADFALVDLAAPDGAAQLVERAWNWRGGVDIWINSAGADVLTGETANWSFVDKLELLWRVDVAGTIVASRAVGQRMKQRGRGVILNVGWDQAEAGMEGDSGEMFAAAKAAAMAFTRSLAKSLAPVVRVNCIAPGWIKTGWGASASKYWQQRAKRDSLLGRWGTPEDVARVARFLASPAAEFINGATIPVNGGWSGRAGDEG